MRTINYNTKDHVATISLNRPEKRNALNDEMVSELLETFRMGAEDADVRVIVLAAEGDAFCAGADLASLQNLQKASYKENLADSSRLRDLYQTIYTLDKVVIARVQGPALAGGCGLVAVCDMVVASSNARFGYTEVRIGFVPAIVSAFLLRKLGEGRCRHLLLSGEIITAEEANNMGLVSRVTSPERLNEDVATLAGHLAKSNSPASVRMTKQLILQLQDMRWEEALNHAAETNARARDTEDCKRGIAAFLNKERILW